MNVKNIDIITRSLKLYQMKFKHCFSLKDFYALLNKTTLQIVYLLALAIQLKLKETFPYTRQKEVTLKV